MTGPATRWSTLAPEVRLGFAAKLEDLAAAGADLDGEARLADSLVPRGARILDAGSGTGRVGAALQARGHHVTAVEPDPDLLELSRHDHPELVAIGEDLVALTPSRLADQGRPAAYDLVLLVGNVLVFLAEGTERTVWARVAALLAPGGRVLVGLDLDGHRPASRAYPLDELAADAATAELAVELHAGAYDLRPPVDDYAVLVLGRTGPRTHDSPPPTANGRTTG